MKKAMTFKSYLLFMTLLVASCFAEAKNVGTIGQIYPIAEEDFLEFIQARAVAMQLNGALSKLNQTLKEHATAYRDRPHSVISISHATQTKRWLLDPSIVLDQDVVTLEGKILAKKGDRINPLMYVPLNKTLIFYDADDKKEIEWVATLDKKLKGKDKLILVKGSLLQEEKNFSRPIYFDQGGVLTKRFQIQHVPATVSQEGNQLRISEVKP